MRLTGSADANKFACMGKKTKKPVVLSRRETQIMDIIFAEGECSAADVLAAIADPPSYSTVRKLLAILVDKGHLKHRDVGGKYFFRPTQPRRKAGQSALARVVTTFYEGSLEKAVAAMLSNSEAALSAEELQRLAELIEDAKRKEKQ